MRLKICGNFHGVRGSRREEGWWFCLRERGDTLPFQRSYPGPLPASHEDRDNSDPPFRISVPPGPILSGERASASSRKSLIFGVVPRRTLSGRQRVCVHSRDRGKCMIASEEYLRRGSGQSRTCRRPHSLDTGPRRRPPGHAVCMEKWRSRRSKPPYVLCGIQLRAKPGQAQAPICPVLACTRRDSPFHRFPPLRSTG
jgi:hypothetical protein